MNSFVREAYEQGAFTMIVDEFNTRTVANMMSRDQRACQYLPNNLADHRGRKIVAEKIAECAKNTHKRLGGRPRLDVGL